MGVAQFLSRWTKLVPLFVVFGLGLGCEDPGYAAAGGEAPLLARVDTIVVPTAPDSEPCTPFQALYLARAAEIARAVVNAPAYEDCVNQRMISDYVQEDDPDLCPNPPCNRQEQIDAAWESLWTAPHVQYVCLDHVVGSVNGGDVHPEFNSTSDTRRVNIGTQWRSDFPDWDPGGYYYNLTSEPWTFRVDEHIHEIVHTSGYVHCEPDDPTCSPSYNGGLNSAPYIFGICAYEVLELSGDACGEILTSACAPGEVRIINDWYAPTTCSCVPMSGDTWALSNQAGWYVTSSGGGGGDARADRQYRGSWQNLHVVDFGRIGRVNYGDVVGIRSNGTGDWFRLSGSNIVATGDPSTAASFKIFGTATGPVGIGSQILLQDLDSQLWMRTTSASGGDLIAMSTYQASTGVFTVERPVRSEMVYLRSTHGKFMGRSPTSGNNLVNVSTIANRNSAFWVLDHNGGLVHSGDQISFEMFEVDKWVRSPGGGTTSVDFLADAVSGSSRYIVTKVAGSSGTLIRHGDTVALRNVSLNLYLTAMPHDYYPYQMMTYGTSAQAWQQFQWNRVSQFDQARPQFDQ